MNEKQEKRNVAGFFSKGSVIIILVVVVAVFAILTNFKNLKPSNLVNILVQTTGTGLITIGMALVIIDRGIDLSVGGIAVLSSSVGIILMVKEGWPWLLCVFIFIAIGLLVGLLNGVTIAKFNITPFITTLATLKITQGLASFLLSGKTVYGLPDAHTFFGQDSFVIPISVWILLLFTVLGTLILRYTYFGRELYAMGGNPTAAWIAGVNITRNRIFVYMISGFLSAVAGLIISSRIMCAQVSIGDGSELDAIAGAVLGGVRMSGGEGKVWGAVIGALVMVMINNGLNLLAVSPYIQTAVKGVVIYGAVCFDALQRSRLDKIQLG